MSREITKNEYLEILSKNYIGHLAYISNNSPFIVPLTYYFDQKENVIISYSNEGHKIEAMRLNSAVSMQIEEIESLNKWKSILIIGDFEELTGSQAKMYLHKFSENVKHLIAKKESKNPELIENFTSKLHLGSIPIVYRINIHEIIARQNI
jgi:nitroimidazol reductase NimA-like FMN-containing flavoprotein (pyridoxamine 5'-phosphate oxidase superfamily)